MLTAAKYAKIGKEVMSFTKELLRSLDTRCGSIDFPRTDRVPANRENLLAARQKELYSFLPGLPGALLLCNSK